MATADNDDVKFLWVQHGKGARARVTAGARSALKEKGEPDFTGHSLFYRT